MKNLNENKRIAIIGLGVMGSVLAELLLFQNEPITVWNRTAEKSKPFVNKGAKTVLTFSEVLNTNDVIIFCISDYNAIYALVEQDDAINALSNKSIINLTTGIPSEAQQMSAFFEQNNAKYLDGAILSYADQMGQKETTLILSGNKQEFENCKIILEIFGGNIKYLGEKSSSASALDQAVLSYMYGALAGFFHGVMIAEKEEIDVALFGAIINHTTPGMGHFIQHEAHQIKAENYDVTLASITTNASTIRHLNETSAYYNLNLDFPKLLLKSYQKAEKLGLGNEELAALIKVFRKEQEMDNA